MSIGGMIVSSSWVSLWFGVAECLHCWYIVFCKRTLLIIFLSLNTWSAITYFII